VIEHHTDTDTHNKILSDDDIDHHYEYYNHDNNGNVTLIIILIVNLIHLKFELLVKAIN